MSFLRGIAAFFLAAIVTGIVAMEVQTTWTNPDLPFWQGRGIAWVAGSIEFLIVLAIVALVLRLLNVSPSFIAHLIIGASANLLVLIVLAMIDGDKLLLVPLELLSALLWGSFAGMLWFLLKRFLPRPVAT